MPYQVVSAKFLVWADSPHEAEQNVKGIPDMLGLDSDLRVLSAHWDETIQDEEETP